MHSIVSVGGIAEDVVLRMRTLPSPGTCVTAAMYRGIGGKAANQRSLRPGSVGTLRYWDASAPTRQAGRS